MRPSTEEGLPGQKTVSPCFVLCLEEIFLLQYEKRSPKYVECEKKNMFHFRFTVTVCTEVEVRKYVPRIFVVPLFLVVVSGEFETPVPKKSGTAA